MDVSHSVCFNVVFEIISKTEILISRRQTFASYQNGFLRSEEIIIDLVLIPLMGIGNVTYVSIALSVIAINWDTVTLTMLMLY